MTGTSIDIENNTNPYRKKSNNNNMTNLHFKKLTETEKKQQTMLSMIHRMKHKAMVINDFRFITNAIASNCAYHEKNMEEQFIKLDRLKVSKEEKDILSKAWDIKFKLGTSLMKDLKELIEYVEKNNN